MYLLLKIGDSIAMLVHWRVTMSKPLGLWLKQKGFLPVNPGSIQKYSKSLKCINDPRNKSENQPNNYAATYMNKHHKS